MSGGRVWASLAINICPKSAVSSGVLLTDATHLAPSTKQGGVHVAKTAPRITKHRNMEKNIIAAWIMPSETLPRINLLLYSLAAECCRSSMNKVLCLWDTCRLERFPCWISTVQVLQENTLCTQLFNKELELRSVFSLQENPATART